MFASCSCLQTSEEKKVSNDIKRKLKKWHQEEERVVKLLLLGIGESGKSTITKQMKIIHIDGYTEAEKLEKIPDIRKNIRDSILTILGAMFHLDIKLKNPENEEYARYLHQEATKDDFQCTKEFYDSTIKLWEDEGVQQCFLRSNEYQLIDSAKYFLDKVNSVRQDNYIPSEQDILRCRVMTNSIRRIDYSIKDGKTDVNFRVFDVGGQRGERRKWIQVFDSVTAILFVVDTSSFDLTLREDSSQNRLLESLALFEQVWTNRFLSNVSIILFLNKIDLLEEKINKGHSLQHLVDKLPPTERYYELLQAFKTFTKPKDQEKREFEEALPRLNADGTQVHGRKRSRTPSLPKDVNEEVTRTAVFIRNLFLQIVERTKLDRRTADDHDSHVCLFSYTCAVDTNNIKKVLDGCKNIVIRRHLERWGVSLY